MSTAPGPTPPATDTAAPRRRILLSIFACSPLWGSECGVGWRWALELARDHDVTVLTHAAFEEHIEPLIARRKVPANIRFIWYAVPGVSGHPHRQLNSQAYYWLWQWAARRRVRRLLADDRYDVIHHLTWGSYRFPSFLGGLGVPLVVGPVGGGETAARRLYRSLPWKERARYQLRELSIAMSRWDPFVMWSMARTACVFARTDETRRALPWYVRERAHLLMELGAPETAARPQARADGERPLQLLFAGRLIGGKGVAYLLEMMSTLQRRGVAAELIIAGNGRLETWMRARIDALGIGGRVRILGWTPREEMEAVYDAADLMVFPSWHDSSGNVVVEALSRGLPLLCLDIGGPSYLIDARCGLTVATAGRPEAELGIGLADHVERLARDRDELRRLARGALDRAREMTWRGQVQEAYRIIGTRLGW